MNIAIKNLTKKFSNKIVLENINVEFNSGNRIGIIGPNGSGKSTLIKSILKFTDFEGDIYFDNNPIDSSGIKNEVRNKIAYIPQISPYFSSKIKDIVDTVLSLRKISLSFFKEVLAKLYLSYDDISHSSFKKLSGGMKQKLFIALAFCTEAKVYCLDEPTASLDAKSREAFYRLFQDLQKDVTVLLSSHRIDEIRHMVSHTLVLEKGNIIFNGLAEDYLSKQIFSIIEIHIDERHKKEVEKLGFRLSPSGWWHLSVKQEKKIEILQLLQNNLNNLKGSSLNNIIIRDIDSDNFLKK